MKRIILLIITIALLLCIGFMGCMHREKIIVGTGVIAYIDLEGGFYGIISSDGHQYDPINLLVEFQEDGLQVKYILEILDDQSNIHQWGTMVEVIHIEKIS